MALTEFQRAVCRVLAVQRVRSGESRYSHDVDLFHDSEEALEASWSADRRQLEGAGYAVRIVRERPSFVEAEVAAAGGAVLVEWARASAFRFFPLVEHPDLGLALHPFDLATNKLLALVGRREVRDWVDLLECDRGLQPLLPHSPPVTLEISEAYSVLSRAQ